jgi:hypothetical protein
MPVGNLAVGSADSPPNLYYIAYERSRYWCWGWPSYYGTPDHHVLVCSMAMHHIEMAIGFHTCIAETGLSINRDWSVYK